MTYFFPSGFGVGGEGELPPVGAAVVTVDVLTVGVAVVTVDVLTVGLEDVGSTGAVVTVGDAVVVESSNPSQLPQVLLHWLFQYELVHQFG